MVKRRTLTPQEKALWSKVAETARPMPRAPKPEPVGPQAINQPRQPAHDVPHSHSGTLGVKPGVGPAHRGVARKPAGTAKPSPPGPDLNNLDGRTAERLRKGKLAIDARIDLHGMTRPEAHRALNRFIIDTHQRGARTVLVITGKGRGRTYDGNPVPVPDMPWERKAQSRFQMPTHTGILREEVPQWLRQAPLAPLVVAATQAQPKHGGAGALYVYLRRDR